MTERVLALDLGTGGCKASLWAADGTLVDSTTHDYPTSHPRPGWNEQLVEDWWDAVVGCTRALVSRSGSAVDGIALSGHSLGVVLLSGSRSLLQPSTPIWSDTRAAEQVDRVFGDEALAGKGEGRWYLKTGNGFTPALYPLFKARWYADNQPDLWAVTRHVVGSKDWVNLRLTGELATDHSYASGSGVYSLVEHDYDAELLAAGGLESRLPRPMQSHEMLGRLLPSAAHALGLADGIPVFAGAVDNAAMALGSRGTRQGRIYAALGSSSWVTVTGTEPLLDLASRPFVFAHVVPGLYISALSTFSSGTTLDWLIELIGSHLDIASLLDEACALPPDTDVPTFIPTLVGGTPLEGGAAARGLIAHLGLGHGRAHLLRAAMEGITFSVSRSLDLLRSLTATDSELLIAGGGSRHDGWNQLYADALGQDVVRTSVGQQAAALGSATLAFVGLGLWTFDDAERPHAVEATYRPRPGGALYLAAQRQRFEAAQYSLAAAGGAVESQPRSHM